VASVLSLAEARSLPHHKERFTPWFLELSVNLRRVTHIHTVLFLGEVWYAS